MVHHYPFDNITAEHIEQFVNIKPAPGVLMMSCGSDTFNGEMRARLQEVGYTPEMCMEMSEDDLCTRTK